MRDSLIDMVRMTIGLFEIVKISGDENRTLIQAKNTDKTLLLDATLHAPLRAFDGVFGLLNLKFLDQVLNNPVYKAPQATFEVRREIKPIAGTPTETVSALVFKDANGKGSTIYKTMAPSLIEPHHRISTIPWGVTIQPAAAKISEFNHHARGFAEVDKTFRVVLDHTDLLFGIGSDNSATHCATMVFASDVTGSLVKSARDLCFDVAPFLALMRLGGVQPMTLKFCDKGILGVNVPTDHGIYDYYLSAKT